MRGVLEHVAVAAVQLDALVDQLVLQLGGPVLRLRGPDGVEPAGDVLTHAVVDEHPGVLGPGRHLGEQEPVVPELADGLAERLARLGVVDVEVGASPEALHAAPDDEQADAMVTGLSACR